MYKILGSILFAFLISTNQVHHQSNPFEGLTDFIENLMKETSVPGVSFVIIENNEVIMKHSLGYADIHANKKLTTEHSFNVGSISKTFTSWGIMHLVENGKLRLSDPLSSFNLNCLEHISAEDQAAITVRDLMQHTAGLSVHGYEGYSGKDRLPSLCESVTGFLRDEERIFVKYSPGSKFQYSGGGYTLLQLIVEEVSGERFESYMEKEIFSKLGMKSTSFDIDDEILETSCVPYDSSGHSLPFERFTAKAAAGLQTTIDDMSKFVLAHFSHNDVITPASLAELQIGSQQSKNNYGKGYMIMERFGAFVLHGHGGSNDGFQSGMMIDMENKSAFIMLTNGEKGKEVIFPALMKWGMERRKMLKNE